MVIKLNFCSVLSENIPTKIEEQLVERSRLRDAERDKIRKKGLGLHFQYKRKNPKANSGQRVGLPTTN